MKRLFYLIIASMFTASSFAQNLKEGDENTNSTTKSKPTVKGENYGNTSSAQKNEDAASSAKSSDAATDEDTSAKTKSKGTSDDDENTAVKKKYYKKVPKFKAGKALKDSVN